MRILEIASYIAQIQQSPIPSSNPLINRGGEDSIYIGVGLLLIAAILAIGFISRRIEYAIVFSVLLSILIIILVVIT